MLKLKWIIPFLILLPMWAWAEGVLYPIAITPSATKYIIRADVARTLPNDTNKNALFNVPTNGRITLPVGTYAFEQLITVSSMSATSGNGAVDIKGAGTATIGSIIHFNVVSDNTLNNTATAVFNFGNAVTSAGTNITTATVSTDLEIWGRGTFEVTTAGTMIPSITQTTAAAATVNAGSYFMVERIGDVNVQSGGPWD